MANRYEDLLVWQKAMALAELAYAITRSFPVQEQFAVSDQMRRAAVSVPSNIAEGQGRLTRGEFKQFLGHARGSLFELQTQVKLAERMKYANAAQLNEFMNLSSDVAKLLKALITSLKPVSLETGN